MIRGDFMDIKRWAAYRLKKLNIWDYGLVKTYCFLAGMIAGAYAWQFVQKFVWIFVVAALSIMLKLWLKVFAKKR